MSEATTRRKALDTAIEVRRREIPKLRALRDGELEPEQALEDPDLAATTVETLCAYFPSGRKRAPKRPPGRKRRDRAALHLFTKRIFGRTRVGQLNLVQQARVLEIADRMGRGRD